MPLYEYRCTHCDHAFTRLTSVANRDYTRCPRCDSFWDVRRQKSAPSFKVEGYNAANGYSNDSGKGKA